MESPAKGACKTILIAVLVYASLISAWILTRTPESRPAGRRLSSIALSRTGRWLSAATAEGRITIWDRGSEAAPIHVDFRHGRLNDLQFSPDERLLAIAGRNLGICVPERPNSIRLLRTDAKNYGSIRFRPDGQAVLVTTGTGLLEMIDVQSGASGVNICCSSIYGEAAFTPDGRMIANAGHWPALWDAHSGRLLGRFTAARQFHAFGPIASDEDGGTILMGSQDGRVYAWDIATRQLVAMSAPQPGYVDALAASRMGWVIYAGLGQSLRLWNPKTGQHRSLAAARPTSNLIVGADGVSLVFGTAEGEIEFWNTEKGQRIW